MFKSDMLKEIASNYEKEVKEIHLKSLGLHKQFLARFPFLDDTSSIDKLTKEDIYNPGSGDYFFYWIEHKLKPLGHIAVGSSTRSIILVLNI